MHVMASEQGILFSFMSVCVLIALFLQRIYGIEKVRHQEKAKAMHPYGAHIASVFMIKGCQTVCGLFYQCWP